MRCYVPQAGGDGGDDAAIAASMVRFRESVLADNGAHARIEPEMFTDLHALHLTLGVLKLYTPALVDRAKQLLATAVQGASQRCLGGDACRISMRGVEYMNDDPSETRTCVR